MDMSVPRLHGANRSIGAILMEAGRLKPDDAERILRLQKAEHLRFGDAALRLGLLVEADIQFALSHQFSYPYLAPGGERPLGEELLAAYQPFSPLVEQLRSVRSQLLLRWFDAIERRNTLAIVGPGPGDGRSYLAANLAVVFSQLGERTLLIDADLRRPRQHELFRVANGQGLSNVLAGRGQQEVVVPIASLSSLDLMPAGPVPPNPVELLTRPALVDLLERCRRDYEVVLIDTPAASLGADAGILAFRAGAALAVACSNRTRVGAFAAMVKSLSGDGVDVVGSVLNDPPVMRA